jgi:hypothetical protein
MHVEIIKVISSEFPFPAFMVLFYFLCDRFIRDSCVLSFYGDLRIREFGVLPEQLAAESLVNCIGNSYVLRRVISPFIVTRISSVDLKNRRSGKHNDYHRSAQCHYPRKPVPPGSLNGLNIKRSALLTELI